MKTGSGGRHGGAHKARDRGANATDRKAAERDKQARIARDRGQRDKSRKEAEMTNHPLPLRPPKPPPPPGRPGR